MESLEESFSMVGYLSSVFASKGAERRSEKEIRRGVKKLQIRISR